MSRHELLLSLADIDAGWHALCGPGLCRETGLFLWIERKERTHTTFMCLCGEAWECFAFFVCFTSLASAPLVALWPTVSPSWGMGLEMGVCHWCVCISPPSIPWGCQHRGPGGGHLEGMWISRLREYQQRTNYSLAALYGCPPRSV